MRIVENTTELKAFVAELSRVPYLALDTEFLRDQTYYPKLCLIQVAARMAGAECRGDHRSPRPRHGPGAIL